MGMSSHNHKCIKTAGFLLAVFSFSALFGQDNGKNNTAEELFNEYSKLGVVVGGSLLFTTNEPTPVKLVYKDVKAFNIGLEYNFLQVNNFNFKIGLFRRFYSTVDSKTLKKEDTGIPFDLSRTTKFGAYAQYHFPLTAEYLWSLNEGLSINFGLGAEILVRPRVPPDGRPSGAGAFYIIRPDGTKIGFSEVKTYKDGAIYLGANVSIGLNIELGPVLLRPTLTYHYQPETLYTIVATTHNLRASKKTISTHEITGNYLMFSLSIIPEQGLFCGWFCGCCDEETNNSN